MSERDLRKAVGYLETASLIGNVIDVDTIYKVSNMAHPDEIIRLLNLALKGNFFGCLEMLDILLIEKGYSSLDIVNQMMKEVMNLNIKDRMKVDIIDEIGNTDFYINEGASENIQMKALITRIIKIGE